MLMWIIMWKYCTWNENKFRKYIKLDDDSILSSSTLFGKEVGSDSNVGFLFPTYIFQLINH